jgi:glycosyltransferase involved in cell wall biosynthesis
VMRSQADLTHLHLPNPMGDLSLLAAPKKCPIVITYHSDIVRQKFAKRILGPLLNHSLEAATNIVTTWPGQQNISKTLAPFREKCITIPLGIDPVPYAAEDHQLPTRQDLAQDELLPEFDEPYFLFLGRFVWYKGLEVLLKAIAHSKKEFKVVLAGGGYLDWTLRDQCRQLGILDRVHFARNPNNTQLIRLMRDCRSLVLPSISNAEVFGVVQLEAFACRRPTINTALQTGVPWVGKDGESSITVPPGDVEKLAEAMDRLYQDESLANRLGKNGHQRLHKEFTHQHMIESYLQLYHSLLKS